MARDLSPDELAKIEERHAAAAPGPWQSFIEGRDHLGGSDFIRTGGEDIYLIGATHADQDFIASAKQNIPLLLAEIRSLRARLGLS